MVSHFDPRMGAERSVSHSRVAHPVSTNNTHEVAGTAGSTNHDVSLGTGHGRTGQVLSHLLLFFCDKLTNTHKTLATR